MYNKPIKEWFENDRPREKFMQKGCAALSDTEPLSILIRSGTQDNSALVVAQEVLQLAKGNLSLLAKLQFNELLSIKGIGSAKAITLMAALELGRRRRISEVIDRFKISSSLDVFELMKPLLEDLHIEQFWTLYLNNSNKVLSKLKISEGGMTGTVVDIRLILKHALELNATSIVLSHNHPSGILKPSEADINVTKKIKKAAQFMDIKVLDHLIITDQSYFSFADQGRI